MNYSAAAIKGAYPRTDKPAKTLTPSCPTKHHQDSLKNWPAQKMKHCRATRKAVIRTVKQLVTHSTQKVHYGPYEQETPPQEYPLLCANTNRYEALA